MNQQKPTLSKEILLAVDGSEISLNASITTVRIAQMLHFGILGLYVIDEELITNDYADYQKELQTANSSLSREERAALFEKRGHEVLQWLKSKCEESGVRVATEIGVGGVWNIALGRAQGAPLLALGRRGYGHPGKPDYLGKNFRYIAHHTHGPFLAGGDDASPMKKFLLAYDGGERAQRALTWAKKFHDYAPYEFVTLVVLENNSESSKEWLKDIESQLNDSQIKNLELVIERGDPSDQIVKVAMKTESNLIIMGGYRHKGLLEWLEGSTLDEVLRNTRIPVLIA